MQLVPLGRRAVGREGGSARSLPAEQAAPPHTTTTAAAQAREGPWRSQAEAAQTLCTREVLGRP